MNMYNGKEFTDQQFKLIQLGNNNGLNVDAYAKPHYSAEKMSNIIAVLAGETHRYNGNEYTDEQIEFIRTGLEATLDVDVYANPKISAENMESIMYIMLSGVNLDYKLLPKLDSGILKLIISGIDKGLKVYHLVNQNYSYGQALEIYLGLENDIDISKYANYKFSSEKMELIRLGMINNVDVSEYLELNRNDIFRRISLCITYDWDIKCVTDKRLSEEQIEVILEGLNSGIDVTTYAKPGLPKNEMSLRLEYIKENGSLQGYKSEARKLYESGERTVEQLSDDIKSLHLFDELPKDYWLYITELYSIYYLKCGKDVKEAYNTEVKHMKRVLNLEKITPSIPYGDYSEEQLDFIFDLFDSGDDYVDLAKPDYTIEQMTFMHDNPELAQFICKSYTLAQMEMLDEFKDSEYFEILANPDLNAEHMEILYHDLIDGYDISGYCSVGNSIDRVKFFSLMQRYNYDTDYFIEKDFSNAQLRMLTRGVIKRIPIMDYAKPEYSVSFMALVEMALENQINIKDILDSKYSEDLEYELFTVIKDSAKPDSHRRLVYARPLEV